MAGRGRVAAFRALGAILERLPERLDVGAAQWIARQVGARSASRENLTDNLTHVLYGPGQAADPALVGRFVERGFENYGRYWAEGAKLAALPVEQITGRFVIAEGLEHLRESEARGQGTVIALPHVGSWEWGGALLAQIGLPMTAIAEALEPPELFEWFRAQRARLGIRIEPLDERAGSTMLGVLREGGVVGLLCDRDLVGNGVEVEFFGERVTLPGGPATLALRTGATLLAAACYSGPGWDHHAVVTAPIPAQREGRLREDVARVTQAVAHELEGLIRRAPEQWHVLERRFAPR